MGYKRQKESSIKHKRTDFLFHDGEFRQRVIPSKKRYLEELKLQELESEPEADEGLYEGSKRTL